MAKTLVLATTPQIELLERLLVERDVEPALRDAIEAARNDLDHPLTMSSISNYITTLKLRPRRQRPDAVTEPGYYEHKGVVYHVVRARAGHLYAKHLTTDEGWQYAQGAMKFLRCDEKIGLDRANELSEVRGQCIRCLRTLTAKASVERGVGPICAQYF